MFDYHLHSNISYDGRCTSEQMAQAAADAGLKEICFTDHLDYMHCLPREKTAFAVENYNRAYDTLEIPGLMIRNGVEVGMTPWNKAEIAKDLGLRHYDFVLGSLHFIQDQDIYMPPYWENRNPLDAEKQYFEELLTCVMLHDDFDVLGHLTYISKCRAHPCPRAIPLEEYGEIITEIMKTLIAKGKGMEVNTSGVDRCGDFLPSLAYLKRFKELGGEIVTVGSDAHATDRVGQYTMQACEMLKDIFGYVCTFEDRKPVFHKL